jgi:hypothetical protein
MTASGLLKTVNKLQSLESSGQTMTVNVFSCKHIRTRLQVGLHMVLYIILCLWQYNSLYCVMLRVGQVTELP